MTKKKPLTDKQKRFIDEYVVDYNATQAAIRAGYSEKTARTQGSLNMTNVDIQAEIKRRQEALSEKLEYTADDWTRDVLELKNRSMEEIELKDEDGNVVHTETKDPQTAHKCLDMLGKRLGLFVEKKQVEVNISDRSSWLNEVLKDVKDE